MLVAHHRGPLLLIHRETPGVAGHGAANRTTNHLALALSATLANSPSEVICGGTRERREKSATQHRSNMW
jgi:hypothetical protein